MSDLILGDSNRAARLLTKTGAGIYSTLREVSLRRTSLSKALYIEPGTRSRIIEELAELRRASGADSRPRVFDGDAAVARPLLREVEASVTRPVIGLGEPFSLRPEVSITLRRSRACNVLVLGDGDDDLYADLSARAVLHSVISGTRRSRAEVDVYDFIGDELSANYATVRDVALVFGARHRRSRDLADGLRDADDLITKRLADEDYSAPAKIIVLFALQRALSLRPADPYSDEVDGVIGVQLARILKDGPEVGVHVVASVDSVANLERRIGSESFGEFGFRVAGSATSPAALQFVSGDFVTVAEVRRHQLLCADQPRGSQSRLRAYHPFTPGELQKVSL